MLTSDGDRHLLLAFTGHHGPSTNCCLGVRTYSTYGLKTYISFRALAKRDVVFL